MTTCNEDSPLQRTCLYENKMLGFVRNKCMDFCQFLVDEKFKRCAGQAAFMTHLRPFHQFSCEEANRV